MHEKMEKHAKRRKIPRIEKFLEKREKSAKSLKILTTRKSRDARLGGKEEKRKNEKICNEKEKEACVKRVEERRRKW